MSARSESSATEDRLSRLDHLGLAEQQLAVLRRGGPLHDLGESVELADHHRGHARAGLPDLLERPLDQPLIGGLGGDHPGHAGGVPVDPDGVPPAGYLAQAVTDPVDAGQRGEGVINRRGQRADRDLGQLVDAERDVLGEGPVRPGDVRAGQVLRHPLGGISRPDRRVGVALHQKVARPAAQMDHHATLAGQPDQQPVLDVLQVAAARRRDLATWPVHAGEQPRGRAGPRARGAATGLQLDRSRQIPGDARDHLGQLDLRRDVVQEVDEHREVGDRQRQRHGDADMRDKARAALAEGPERQDGVDERGHEGPQRHLRAAVADEVAQHPRPELGGRQGQGHDHHGEHHADDGDDGRCDRDEDLPRRVRRTR